MFFLLPCAAVWSFKQDISLTKDCRTLSRISWENQPWLEKEFFYEKLRETFIRILPRYFRANQKIGISLTGGLDTRMIVANMDMPHKKYSCYTFSGMYRDSFDVKVARKVARGNSHKIHQAVKLDRKFLADFPKYAEKTVYISDGYFDVSGSPEIIP